MFNKRLISVMFSAVFAAIIMGASAVTAFAENTGGDTAASPPGMGNVTIFMIIAMIVIMFLLSRPQKKKEREAKQMQDTLQVGDEVVTIGGIIGMVVRKSEDNIVIETGGDRSKLRVKLWAISENITATEKAEAEKAEMKKNRGLATAPEKKSESPAEKKPSKGKKK